MTKREQRYAATRDATWSRGGGGSAGSVKYHIVREPLKDEMSECGVIVFALHHDVLQAVVAEGVPLNSRCKRPACRAAWALIKEQQ